MIDFEKLGVFYLGKIFDSAAGKTVETPLLYDTKDLTTHALCVGMTGSGKTGLCVSLLEEAAIDNIPAIVIDPKGDLANLLLAFPNLQPQDFEPWMDPAEAARQGVGAADLAAKTAQSWRDGLASWGQSPDRIARFRDSTDAAIYTPGSRAGLPVSVLKSFAAPPAPLRAEAELMHDRIAGAASGLLALLGIDADPLQSREHILIANLLEHAWREGRDVGIADLIRAIQSPPFDKLGVMDIESFYPSKDRAALALRLNNLLASPGFQAWTDGEPLDIQRMLYTPAGKPRISIFSIAHLSDAERMFFVTLLLNETIAWMRAQPGTSSLRAILYMDEIFGFFPPSANPPSKAPMLTLLKQARAFGLGCVLATQNPVDLDYKGLANCGTWFIGRLQTERDKLRILDGLEGASQGAGRSFDRDAADRMISGLAKRVFLMNNVHEDAPVLFQTRWALSYLGGPLTRAQIETLMAPRKAAQTPASPATPPSQRAAAAAAPPILPPDIKQVFLPAADPAAAHGPLRPMVLAEAKLHFVSATAGIDDWATIHALADIPDSADSLNWDQADIRNGSAPSASAPADASFADVPGCAAQPKNYAVWGKSFAQFLYQTWKLTLHRCPALKLTSKPGESEGDFRVRIRESLRQQRDQAIAKIRAKHAAQLAAIDSRIRAAEARIQKESAEYQDAKMQSMLSAGASVLGALLGSRKLSITKIRSVGTSIGRVSRAGKQRADVTRAEESLEALAQERAGIEGLLAEEMAKLQAAPDENDVVLEEVAIPPRKSDISVAPVRLAWIA